MAGRAGLIRRMESYGMSQLLNSGQNRKGGILEWAVGLQTEKPQNRTRTKVKTETERSRTPKVPQKNVIFLL